MENIPRASIHVGEPAKSFSAAEGAEPERRGWDEEMYIYKNNSDRDNHYDFSRSKFNFEINSKGEIMPLGSNPIPLHERVMHRLEKQNSSHITRKTTLKSLQTTVRTAL